MTDISRPPAAGRSGHRLESMFAPRSIAILGASEKSIWTAFAVKNLRDLDFQGRAYAVNREGRDVMGMKGGTSCADLPEVVDVVFVTLPQAVVADALDEAGRAGVRNAVVLTAGYAEVGSEGKALQADLLAVADRHGMAIWGPNSLGFNNVAARAGVSAVPVKLPVLPPMIAIVSQSGATASELNELAHSQNIGTSFVAATGNEAQLTLADVIDYLVSDQDTRAIAVFAESVRDPATFERACGRARKARKPIVMLKIGRSALAGEVAAAHTGSLAGDDRVFDSVCERLGVIRVFSPEDLIATAGLLAATGPLPPGGIAFFSISGGACTLAADGAEAAGVALPAFSPETVAQLDALTSAYGSSLNPFDITGAAMRDPGMFERLIPIAANAEGIGLTVINMAIPFAEDVAGFPEALPYIGRAAASLSRPVVMVTTTTKTLTDMTREAIAANGLPHVICGIDPMLRAAGRAIWWSAQLDESPLPLTLAQGDVDPLPNLSSERAVLEYLGGQGIPVIPAVVAKTRAEAETAGIDGPLAMKILSPDITHKTEVGGVRLNVATADVGTEFDAILADVGMARPDARIEGVTLSPMRSGGLELLLGVNRDSTWGPTITVGFGGVLVELLADVTIAPLPVTYGQAVAMLKRLRGAKLLDGYRGAPASDVSAVADAVVRTGNAALKLGARLQSMEINPLIVNGSRVEALDGLVIQSEGE